MFVIPGMSKITQKKEGRVYVEDIEGKELVMENPSKVHVVNSETSKPLMDERYALGSITQY